MNQFNWKLLNQSSISRARTGIISTPHGKVNTPAFIFCGTKAAIKTLNVKEAKESGTQIILSNTYHLMLQPGGKIIVITFNLKEDILKRKSWRYDFIKKQLKQRNIIHIDSLKILKLSSKKYNERIENYYSEDLHNSTKGFERILNKFYKIYNAI